MQRFHLNQDLQNLTPDFLCIIWIYFTFSEILDRLLTIFSGKLSWRLFCILWLQLLLSVAKAYKLENFQRSFSSRYLLKRKANMQLENTVGEMLHYVRIMSMGKLTYYGCFLYCGLGYVFFGMGFFGFVLRWFFKC